MHTHTCAQVHIQVHVYMRVEISEFQESEKTLNIFYAACLLKTQHSLNTCTTFLLVFFKLQLQSVQGTVQHDRKAAGQEVKERGGGKMRTGLGLSYNFSFQ